MKMNQPQTWDGDMFAEFLHKTKLGCVALKFSIYFCFIISYLFKSKTMILIGKSLKMKSQRHSINIQMIQI